MCGLKQCMVCGAEECMVCVLSLVSTMGVRVKAGEVAVGGAAMCPLWSCVVFVTTQWTCTSGL